MSIKTTDSVTVSVNYAVDEKFRHWLYFFQDKPRTDEERAKSEHKTDKGGKQKQVQLKIKNARLLTEPAKFDDFGFTLKTQNTSLKKEDFYKLDADEEIKKRYYGELEEWTKQELGASHVIAFNHQVRGPGRGIYAVGEPHTDASPITGDELYFYELSKKPELYKKINGKGRFLYFNMWRNISDTHSIRNNHLAILDERTTLKPDDYIVKDLYMRYGDYIATVPQYSINYRNHKVHDWYYYPEMEKNEVLLFKQYDTDYRNASRLSFHMAIKDPLAASDLPMDYPARESIEVRLLAFFPDADIDTVPSEVPDYIQPVVDMNLQASL